MSKSKLRDKLRAAAEDGGAADNLLQLMLQSARRIDELEKSENFWISQDYHKRMRITSLRHMEAADEKVITDDELAVAFANIKEKLHEYVSERKQQQLGDCHLIAEALVNGFIPNTAIIK